MFKRITAIVLCVLLGCSALAGCSSSGNISSGAAKNDFPVTVENVTITSQPSGVAVLSANMADVILELGYEIQLKAKSQDCTQSDLQALPNVTADDAAAIKSLGANLVLTDTQLSDAQQAAMKTNGITVVTLTAASGRSDLSRLYSEVGSAMMGGQTGYQKGQAAASSILETIDDITRVIPQSDTPVTAVYLYDAKGSAATGDTLAGNLIDSAGFTNAAEGATGGKFAVSDLLLANPQYVFCAAGVKAQLESSDQLKKLSAVQNGKVFEMDPGMMQLQGRELLQAVSFMAGTAYPQLLAGTSSDSSADTSSSSSGINSDQTLNSGMQNNDVLTMQNRLKDLGYMFVKPTGLYGDATTQAVRDFQYLNGLTVTGIADPATLKLMFSDSAVPRTS